MAKKKAVQSEEGFEAVASAKEVAGLKSKLAEQAASIEALRSGLEKAVAALNQLKERNRLR